MFCTTSHAFNAGSSTSVFLLGRIRKVSSLFLFIFLKYFFWLPGLAPLFFSFFLGGGGGWGAPRVVLDIPMVWGLRLGSS